MDWRTALTDREALRAQGLFVAEGRLVLDRILAGAAGGPDAIVSVLAAPAAVQALDLEARLPGRLMASTPSEMEALTGFNFHRGVLALVRRPPVRSVSDVIATVTKMGVSAKADGRRPKAGGVHCPVLVIAEHLVDVDNIGSCFRNARGFGAAGVLLDERCPDPLYRKAVRTSLGHVLDVPWAQAPIDVILQALREHDVTTVGLSPRGLATTDRIEHLAAVSGRLDPSRPVAVLIGNEGSGLSDSTMSACTHLASIPMAPGADSLNVATALAVSLYELTRQGLR